MNDIYDIAVVGAGPAGSFFAKELRRLCPCTKLAVIDGQTEERKKPCGGLLSPDAQRVFAQFNMTLPNNVLADPQIFTVETLDIDTQQRRNYQRHYLNMDRYKLDRFLLSALPRDADLIKGRVKYIEKKGEIYELVLSDMSILARAIVGADGSGSRVRRMLGKKYPLQYVAIQEWYKGANIKLPYYSCIFDKKTSGSCSWTIHKDSYVIFGGAFERKGCRTSFAEQKARLEAFYGAELGEPLKREACLVSSPRSFFDLYCGKRGAYLIGEAAGFISASSFEGISYALLSAKKLAEAFALAKGRGVNVIALYRKKTFFMRVKLFLKMIKRAVLCTPFTRYLIMKSGIQSISTEKK